MDRVWISIEFLNLVIFTAFILHRKEHPGVKPLISTSAIHLLKVMYLLPILAFAWSLWLTDTVSLLDWGCLIVALFGNLLVIKGKRDLGASHTWVGYWLPHAPIIRTGIFAWLSHPMYTGISLVILSCSVVYLTRLPLPVSVLALLCCAYIVGFLVIAAVREERLFLHPRAS